MFEVYLFAFCGHAMHEKIANLGKKVLKSEPLTDLTIINEGLSHKIGNWSEIRFLSLLLYLVQLSSNQSWNGTQQLLVSPVRQQEQSNSAWTLSYFWYVNPKLSSSTIVHLYFLPVIIICWSGQNRK